MNWRIQFVFFINVSWLTSVCKWDTLICLPCSPVILYFFPWLKRTFLMWHPPSAHINTHTCKEFEGGVEVETHTHTHAGKDTQTQPFDYRQQFSMRMPSKRHEEYVATHPALSNGCPQKSHQQLFLFWHHADCYCYKPLAKYPSNVQKETTLHSIYVAVLCF